MTGIPIFNVNNNCSTGSTALYLARQAVEAGVIDVALALGPCSQPSELRGPTYSGLFFPSVMKNSNES